MLFQKYKNILFLVGKKHLEMFLKIIWTFFVTVY